MIRMMLAWALAAGVFAAGAGEATAASLAEVFSPHAAGAAKVVHHEAWDRLLKRFVVARPDGLNRVDYARFKAEGHKALKSYISGLEQVDVATLDRPEQFAFWANLYNAKTIDVVLDHYPVSSIRKIDVNESLFGFLKKSVGLGGPWKSKIMVVGGQNLSLDDVEHNILRPIFKDPRVHYAVNCASVGCPDLRAAAFTGASLDTALDAAATAYVNSPRGVVIANGKLTVSSIYTWFQSDFGGSVAGVLAHLRTYAKPGLKDALARFSEIDAYAYDWSLNDITQ